MKKSLKKLEIPTFHDTRGDLSAIELKDYVSWVPKRVYYVTNVTEDRGGHAVVGEEKIYVCMQGTMTARFHDGKEWQEFELQGPQDAVLMSGLYFREFKNFSPGAVLMAISNMNYEKDKYIYDFEAFLQQSQIDLVTE